MLKHFTLFSRGAGGGGWEGSTGKALKERDIFRFIVHRDIKKRGWGLFQVMF